MKQPITMTDIVRITQQKAYAALQQEARGGVKLPLPMLRTPVRYVFLFPYEL